MVTCVEIAYAFKGLGRFHGEDLVQVGGQGGERLTTYIGTSEMLAVG